MPPPPSPDGTPDWSMAVKPGSGLGAPLSARQAFLMLLGGGCLLAAVTHIAFGYLFWRHHVPAMVWFNVISVVVYAIATLLMRRDVIHVAMLLIMSEVIGHAVAASIAVGWASGFHLYLFVVVPLLLLNPIHGWPVRMLTAAVVGIGYVALDMTWQRHPGLHALPPDVIERLHTFNQATTLTIVSALTILHAHLIAQAEARLQDMATTDSLTGLMNRRSIMAALHRLQQLRTRKPQPVTVILVDLDHFKQLNDTHGHALGDWALQAVADVLTIGVRDIDLVCRWGGEEFLIVLPDTDLQAGHRVAERLRLNVSALRIPLPRQPGETEAEHRLTATLGVAMLAPEQSIEAAIHQADVALYQGKSAGRDQVVLAA